MRKICWRVWFGSLLVESEHKPVAAFKNATLIRKKRRQCDNSGNFFSHSHSFLVKESSNLLESIGGDIDTRQSRIELILRLDSAILKIVLRPDPASTGTYPQIDVLCYKNNIAKGKSLIHFHDEIPFAIFPMAI